MLINDTSISVEIQPSGERRLTVQGIIGLSINLSREQLQQLLDELSLALKLTHYEVLGVPHDATPDAIQTAFRARAKERHPDVSEEGDSHTAMQELNKAFDTLSDSTRRTQYDQRR